MPSRKDATAPVTWRARSTPAGVIAANGATRMKRGAVGEAKDDEADDDDDDVDLAVTTPPAAAAAAFVAVNRADGDEELEEETEGGEGVEGLLDAGGVWAELFSAFPVAREDDDDDDAASTPAAAPVASESYGRREKDMR